jgi:hypothetical protein
MSTRPSVRDRKIPVGRPTAAQKEFNTKVREWAAANGHHDFKPRGRVPESVTEAYRRAGKK